MQTLFFETLAIGLGTYVIRFGSLSLGRRFIWPAWLQEWLSFVTPAVLGAFIGLALLMSGRHIEAPAHNPSLWAGIATAIVAWISRSLFWTVCGGVILFMITSRFI